MILVISSRTGELKADGSSDISFALDGLGQTGMVTEEMESVAISVG